MTTKATEWKPSNIFVAEDRKSIFMEFAEGVKTLHEAFSHPVDKSDLNFVLVGDQTADQFSFWSIQFYSRGKSFYRVLFHDTNSSITDKFWVTSPYYIKSN